jgi:hypothetical protein
MASINDHDISIIEIFTFPIWFTISIAFFGVVIISVVVGIIGAILDVLIGFIALPFKPFFD